MTLDIVLPAHFSRYPAMKIQDIYKLIHQAALGSEHAVSNRRLRLGPALKSHLRIDPGTAMRRCKVDWRDIIFPSPK